LSHFLSKLALLSLLLVSSGQIAAEENCANTVNSSPFESEENLDNAIQQDCVEIGQWQIGFSAGLGARTNPLIDGDNIPLIFLPSISYYGESFFINNLDVGYTLHESNEWTVNLLTTPALDRIYFERWDVGNFFVDLSSSFSPPSDSGDSGSGGNSGNEDNLAEVSSFDLKDRKVSWMGGLEFYRQSESGSLFQLSILKDILNVHSGTEARFAWSIPLGNESWSTTLGFTWKDQKMADYYYGLEENEITDDRAAYSAKSSFNPFIRLSWLENTNANSAWRFSMEYQKFGKGIGNSPILDSDSTWTIFVGKQYNF